MKNKRNEIETVMAIYRLSKSKGYQPSIIEIANAIGLSKSATNGRISSLIKDGYLNKSSGMARTITITDKGLALIDR